MNHFLLVRKYNEMPHFGDIFKLEKLLPSQIKGIVRHVGRYAHCRFVETNVRSLRPLSSQYVKCWSQERVSLARNSKPGFV